MTNDEIGRAHGARWAALCRLSDVVLAIQKLPQDAPEDVVECLEGYLDDLQEAYVLAFEAHKAATLRRT